MDTRALQAKVKKLHKTNGWNTPLQKLALHMQGELGELGHRLLAEDPNFDKSFKLTFPIEDCVGDLGQDLLAFCNQRGIDFEKCVLATIKTKGKKK